MNFISDKMPKTRKSASEYDLSTAAGRKELSSLRNRGADMAIKFIQHYQEASEHNVSQQNIKIKCSAFKHLNSQAFEHLSTLTFEQLISRFI